MGVTRRSVDKVVVSVKKDLETLHESGLAGRAFDVYAECRRIGTLHPSLNDIRELRVEKQ